MAEYVRLGIEFGGPFDRDHLVTFFSTLRQAVRENWAAHRDALSWPCEGGEDLEIDERLAATRPESMKPSVCDSEVRLTDGWISFAFGPLSAYCGLLTVGRRREGRLFAWLSVCTSEMYRNDMRRLRHRQEFEAGFEDPRLLPDPNGESDAYGPDWDEYDRIPEILEETDRRYRLYYRGSDQVWAISAACLRHIFERLSAALPVERSWIDREILAGSTDAEADPWSSVTAGS